MDAHKIVELANDVHFRPGWKVEAVETTAPDGTPCAAIRVLSDTVNSDQDQAVKGYPEKITLENVTFVKSGDFTTPDELYAAMITWLIDLEVHECREFFRVGEDMAAPFHPHRPEGNRLWNRLVAA